MELKECSNHEVIKNSFSGILSSQNNSLIRHSSSRIESEGSSKKIKSNTTESISYVGLEENAQNDNTFISELKTESIEDRKINIEQHNKNMTLKDTETFTEKGKELKDSKFISDLMMSLSNFSSETEKIDEYYGNENKEEDVFFLDLNAKLRTVNFKESFTDGADLYSKDNGIDDMQLKVKIGQKPNGNCFIESGFKTAKNNKIFINSTELENANKLVGNECASDLNRKTQNNVLKLDNDKKNDSELDNADLSNKNVANSTGLETTNKFMGDGYISNLNRRIDENIGISQDKYQSTKSDLDRVNSRNKNVVDSSQSETTNNLIEDEHESALNTKAEDFLTILDKDKNFSSKSDSINLFPDNTNNYVVSGFKTANNKQVYLDPRKINNQILLDNDCTKSEEALTMNYEQLKEMPKNTLIRRYNIPQKSHISCKSRVDELMTEVYNDIKRHFKKEESGWIHEQFKWCWLHLYINNMVEQCDLKSEIISLMQIKLNKEFSILRRMVEFDDISYRFMVLGIIDYNEKHIELYDGYYSLKFEIDSNIYRKLTISNADIGTRLYVFGSELLIKEPTNIFDIKGTAMKLSYNSIKLCYDNALLGKSRKLSFLNKISALRSDGGVVSALIVKIKKIIEYKYLVKIENYRNRVDDLEAEIEKIQEIALKTGYELDDSNINVKQYCKMIIEDESGECQLTWWAPPPELKAGLILKIIYLTPVQGTIGLHLSTTRKTYFEEVNLKQFSES